MCNNRDQQRYNYSIFWSLILISAGCSREKPLPHEVMSLIPLKPFRLNQKLDSIAAYPLPNKPTEPHFWEMQFSSYCSYLCAEVCLPRVSSLCSWPLRREGRRSHLHREERREGRQNLEGKEGEKRDCVDQKEREKELFSKLKWCFISHWMLYSNLSCYSVVTKSL